MPPSEAKWARSGGFGNQLSVADTGIVSLLPHIPSWAGELSIGTHVTRLGSSFPVIFNAALDQSY